MTTYRACLRAAEAELEQAQCGEQAALMLMLELSEMEAHNLYMEYEEEMPDSLYQRFQEGIRRLKQNEPLGHIIGHEWFYGYQFKVSGDVLIPRPETEELVANVLAEYDTYFADQSDEIFVADVGTGSGAIAIALQKEEPRFHVLATDISKEAVDVAYDNAMRLEANVQFVIGDMLEPLIERNMKFDILVSNPPYIPQDEVLEESVKDYEPHLALFGGEDGLKFYREIFAKAKEVMKERSFMAFEMGWNQKEAMLALVKEYLPDARAEVLKDMSGKDRMLFVYFGLERVF